MVDILTNAFADLVVAAPPVVRVVKTDAEVESARLILRALTVEVLALDAEGVDLCRDGELCIIQLGTPSVSFLFDVLNEPKESPLIKLVKEILKDDTVCKVIHDCKMVCDALYHQYGIRLRNVHDTQAWDATTVRLPKT
jgi:exonuclease 3'-5' domain-containing protein 1